MMPSRYAPGLTMSRAAADVLGVLAQEALASVDDMIKSGKLPRARAYSGVNELCDSGLVDSVDLGWSRDKVSRYHLTGVGLEWCGDKCSPWHEEWGLARLLQRLPLVEWAYQVTGEIDGLGPLQEFQWMDSVSFDAAVRFRDGWAAIVWSGSLQKESAILERLRAFGRDMVALSTTNGAAWPSLLCFIVQDQWQRELVRRVIRQFGPLEDRVAVWCVADGSRSGASHPLSSRNWVHQQTYPRDMGGWSWERRVRQSPWAKSNGSGPEGGGPFEWNSEGSVLTRKILDFLAQRPDSTTNMIREAMGEDDPHRSVHRRLKRIFDAGLIERRRIRGERVYRYSLSPRGMDLLVKRDRVESPKSNVKTEAPKPGNDQLRKKRRRGSRQAHEDGLTWLLAGLMRAGVPVASGQRSWEHLGDGGIAPDGMALLADSPYGPTWVYIELERTAKGKSRVEKKLKGYSNPRRQDCFPVLVIAMGDSAEQNFQHIGNGAELKMGTTTVGRLDEYGFVDPRCWSMYGDPMFLGL